MLDDKKPFHNKMVTASLSQEPTTSTSVYSPAATEGRMFDFDVNYFAKRARVEGEQARRATDIRASRAHRELANAYVLRAMGAALSETRP